MTQTKRRIEITFEHEETTTIHGVRRSEWRHCAECGRKVHLISVAEAMAICGVGSRAIHSWVEEGRVHFAEMPDGFLALCLNSLPQ